MIRNTTGFAATGFIAAPVLSASFAGVTTAAGTPTSLG
ncbi:MAG: hypothetical protein K0S37_2810 [Microbacterium sp.]|jgi:hypothetical protein|nr:hypothetical protein [Microbacterium sp.]